MDTVQWATLLFVLAALGGAAMAAIRIGGKRNPPGLLAAGHGVLALVGLGLLSGLALGGDAGPLVLWGLAVAAAAALGGLWMAFGFHMRDRLLPVAVVAAHGVLALAAIVLLVVWLLGPQGAAPGP